MTNGGPGLAERLTDTCKACLGLFPAVASEEVKVKPGIESSVTPWSLSHRGAWVFVAA